MDTIMVNPAVGAPAQTRAAAQTQGTASSTDQRFADVLNALSSVNAQTSDVQATGWREMQAMMNGTALSADTQNAGLGLDLSQLLKLLEELGESGQTGEGQDLLNAFLQMQKRMQQIQNEQGQAVAGGELMALIAAMAQDMPQNGVDAILQTLTGSSDQALENVLSGNSNGNELMELYGLTQQSTVNNEDVLTALLQAQNTQTAKSIAGTAQVADGEEAIEILPVESQKTEAVPIGQDFESAVRIAKEKMAAGETETTRTKPEPDVDALQKQVDSGAYLKNTPLSGSTQVEAETMEAEIPSPATQVQDGVLEGIRTGKEEFSIKLNPEGLGEVTIKLTKGAEGMTLNIIAKNAETQKVLNTELDMLRDNLRPMKVEVDSILTEQQYSMLSGQQSSQQQQRDFAWESMRGAVYYGDEPLGAAEPQVQAGAIHAAAYEGQAVLDTYI